ncbi:MAG: hypothetical protein IIA33_07780 [Planctomycetes bacterium]|nr:hypothetical protein [Planctomycetota bacterium]
MTLVNGRHRLESLIDRLFGYAMSLASDRSEAEDILQDCIVRALAAKRVPKDEAAALVWAETFRMMRAALETVRPHRTREGVSHVAAYTGG